MELNRLVQDQPPGQMAPRPAPQNLAEHLPNVPSYRPSVTRIPVLICRRTTLSNSSFAKGTRSSIRCLGSVISPPACWLPVACMVLLHGLSCLPEWAPWSKCVTTRCTNGKPTVFLRPFSCFVLVTWGALVPFFRCPKLAIQLFELHIAFCRSSFFMQAVTCTLV
jgi:hypothetical protein